MDIVWLTEEKCWARVVNRLASHVIVKYENGGLEHEEILEYADIMEPSEMGIEYEGHEE